MSAYRPLAASPANACYHCGLPLPPGVDIAVDIDGAPRAMCCAGCAAVARAIVDAGLLEYYRHRDALPESPREALPDALSELALFDHAEFQKSFVRPVGADEREADLILEGITCAACVWLNEAHLARLPGVTAVQVNYATRRARVRWAPQRIELSAILGAIAAIGYRAHPYDAQRNELLAQRERRTALWRLLVAGFGMMQVMMYAYPAYIARAGELTADIATLMRWASLLLTLPVVLYSAAPFFQRAWRDLWLRRLGMDMPVALGIGAAFAASLYATLRGDGEVYFDSVTMFVFLLLCGRYLEMGARQHAVRGIEALARVVPAFAERYAAWPQGPIERVPLQAVQPGDVLSVRPGVSIAVDGVVLEGHSEADESWLTGESRAQTKQTGARVLAGSVNGSGPLVVRAEAVGEATRIALIRRLMEGAAAGRPRIVEQADRVAAGFVLALLVLALLTAAYWSQVDPARAVWIFASVLVVSCPCALSLATPVALTVATARMAREGLLVTRGHAIEALAAADLLVFDKTGTLSEGRMRVHAVQPFGTQRADQILAAAAALEQRSEHAIGRAIVAQHAAALAPVVDLQAFAGRGLQAQVAGELLRIGNAEFVDALCGDGRAPAHAASEHATSVVYLGAAGECWGCLLLADTLRGDAGTVVAALRDSGLKLAVLSGDHPLLVARVAAQLGIADARGGMLPEDKHAAVCAWQAAGHTVVMVGDGVNDAPVLAQAQVSVALGAGSDLARQQADMVLLGEHLLPLLKGRRLALRTLRIVRQNLGWAFAYNLSAVPLAMCGWVTPWMAGIGMSLSSLLVVLNALRLRRGA